MAPPTLSQLLQQYSVEELTDIILGVYQAAGFPITAWQPFGTERTRVAANATVGNLVSAKYLPQLAASGFINLALTAAPDFVPLIAEQSYNIIQNPAQPTIGFMQLTNTSTRTYSIDPGKLIMLFQLTGNRYTNLDTISLPANTPLSAPVNALFQSVGTGSIYNDPANQGGQDAYGYTNTGNLVLVTPFPGVGVQNAPQTSVGAHTGPSQGTISLSLPGSPLNSYIIVSINVSGNVSGGSMYFSYSLNGSAFSPAIQAVSSYPVPNTGGIDLLFADASGSNPSNFYAGDSWTFNVPGDWKIQVGTDIESNASVATRSTDQWNRTAQVPTSGFYESLVRATPNVGNQIQATIINVDPNINGRVNCCVSGPDGYLSPQVLQSVQAYVSKFAPETDNPVVFPPQTATIDFEGTITVLPSVGNNPVVPLPQIQEEVQVALTQYIQSVPINGTIKLSSIIEIVREQTGVTDINTSTLQIIVDSVAQSGNYTLGSSTTYVQAVAVFTTFQFTWLVSAAG